MSFVEHAVAGEAQFDFCLWQYPPLLACGGKLRSINLLANSFAVQEEGSRALDMMLAVRREFGELRTVWGVKQAGVEISWELYFYDYARTERERSISRLLAAIRPWVSCAVKADEQTPYFMFSIDLSRQLLRTGGELDEIQMYIGNIGSTVSSGICYGVTREQTLLKNFYFFFDARKEMGEIVGKVSTSAFLAGGEFTIADVLWPELSDCEVIVVANKTDRDGVYFSRIKVAQLLWFMRRLEYPPGQIEYLEEHIESFDHMLYDVGFDYRMKDGRLEIVKSAYYGVF